MALKIINQHRDAAYPQALVHKLYQLLRGEMVSEQATSHESKLSSAKGSARASPTTAEWLFPR